MIRRFTLFVALFLIIFSGICQMTPYYPESDAQNENVLLQKALQVEPEVLEGGYRRYDLVVAQLATWNDGNKDIVVRLILPPEESAREFPVVAYVHGGGYIGGSPLMDINRQDNGFSVAFRSLVDSGFAVASLGYRLAREAGWPAQIADVLTGLRFLALHGQHWGVDARKMGISGHSAGARLAVLPALLEKGTFAYPELPWQQADYKIGAVWMWAGSAWDWPTVDQWVEFGKPTYYSVPRLLYGEHPATSDESRHRFRIKASIPHLSMDLPPLYMLRGASDYGGDHSDARKTLEVWQALGAEAHLAIIPGGHSATGPAEPLVDFFTQHIKKAKDEASQSRNPALAARLLNDMGEYKTAIEVLVQANTQNHGNTLPEGSWLILHDQSLLWNPTGNQWPENQQNELLRAKKGLADAEISFASNHAGQTDWYRIVQAAENALSLGAQNPLVADLYDQSKKELAKEEEILLLLKKANEYWHQGKRRRARKLLKDQEDNRISLAYRNITGKQVAEKPEWASQHGVDIYGEWVSITLQPGVDMRFRRVVQGQLALPEMLAFLNTADDVFTKSLTVDDGFWMAETETTREQWFALMDESSGQVNEEENNHPVSMVDYLQIEEWIERLNAQHQGIAFHLPTEEQWLYAAYNPEIKYPSAYNVAVHALSSAGQNPAPMPVRTTLPDFRGYYGLLGGVMEWTSSPGHSIARVKDENGNDVLIPYPIARGGAWSNMPQTLDLGNRMQQRHGNRQQDLGFRMAIEVRE